MKAGGERGKQPGDALIRSALLERQSGVVHGFSQAVDERGARLDLGTGATPERWRWLAQGVGLPGAGVARLVQVHGRVVHEVCDAGVAGEGDALITRTPGLLLAVRTADCVPVLLAGRGVVAAVHAGWRGLAAKIIEATVDQLGEGPLVAAVGPCISVDHYEVSEELVQQLRATGVPEEVFVRRRPGAPRPHADLRRVALAQLLQVGVAEVEVLPHCTWATPGLWSHRRDGLARGSLAAAIGLRGD